MGQLIKIILKKWCVSKVLKSCQFIYKNLVQKKDYRKQAKTVLDLKLDSTSIEMKLKMYLGAEPRYQYSPSKTSTV